MNKKLILSITLFVAVATLFASLSGKGMPSSSTPEMWSQQIVTSSNFFGKPENTDPVTIPADADLELTGKGYQLISETDAIALYFKERFFNLAIVDKESGYIWYSVYPDYLTLGYSGASRFFLESGVILEYYSLENILIEDQRSYVSGSRYNVDVDFDYEAIPSGVKAHLTFKDLAIEFDVLIWIEDDQLLIKIPNDSIVEGDVEKRVLNLDGSITTKLISYRIKSIYVFPYFGANNHAINGYSFIPDGSGALIRYESAPKTTAYIKRIYGTDYGYKSSATAGSETSHIRDEFTASMPIYGVNHGYNQAAFLAMVDEGSTATEIHSYPYGYNSYPINTTFFKYILRERYQVTTSETTGDSFQLINTQPYPVDFQVSYHFLSGTDASYSGMAMKYREILGLDEREDRAQKMNLSWIGQDFKSGLFGRNYVTMTTYQDIIDIVSGLMAQGIDDFDLTYVGWSKNGYFGQTPTSLIPSGRLGGKRGFAEMMDFLNASEIAIYFKTNPIVAFSNQLGKQIVKKMTLANFQIAAERSSLITSMFYRNPQLIADWYIKNSAQLDQLGIENLQVASLGSALFSYRYGGQNYFREETLKQILAEMAELQGYSLSLEKVYSYLWPFIDQYQNTPIESNKYAYLTDSIPFIQLVLSGKVSMISPDINFVSDYQLFALRLVEYNVAPSFLLTKEPTHLLRYTNFEYVFTSEYTIWEEIIHYMHEKVCLALDQVSTLTMLHHRYIQEGVACVDYSQGVRIYVNYTSNAVVVEDGVIPAMDWLVVSS
ncbi:MAG: DUF5696 domain-containing protein [Candidatus Izemoplasmatales bacterium]|nr:DUF5696 domain-containing protein [Candidatus Izemoplasmatales bacterium]